MNVTHALRLRSLLLIQVAANNGSRQKKKKKTAKRYDTTLLTVMEQHQGSIFAIFPGDTGRHPLFINLDGITLCSELLAVHKP